MAVILVVDDDDVLRQVTSQILEANGHEVFRAHGGFAALLVCQARAGTIDLVLTNEHLPDMAGWELVRLAQCTQPQARAVYVASNTATDASDAALRRPFAANELLEAVREQVEAPR